MRIQLAHIEGGDERVGVGEHYEDGTVDDRDISELCIFNDTIGLMSYSAIVGNVFQCCIRHIQL